MLRRSPPTFERLPDIIDGAPSGRVLIAAGLLVNAFAVYGVLMVDGAVELVGITMET